MMWFEQYRLVAQFNAHLICTLHKFRYYANKYDTSYFRARLKYKRKNYAGVFMLKLVIMSKFSTNEYCEMVLISGEYGRQARAAQRLYRQRFLVGPHPSRQVIGKEKKRFRETGSVTHKYRTGRSRRVEQQMQPEDVLAYALAHPQSSIRDIKDH